MTRDHYWYAFPLDEDGNILNEGSETRPILKAGCQRDARGRRLRVMVRDKMPVPDGMLVVLTNVPYKDMDVHKDEYEYWIYDRDGFCCSPGEGPRDPFA